MLASPASSATASPAETYSKLAATNTNSTAPGSNASNGKSPQSTELTPGPTESTSLSSPANDASASPADIRLQHRFADLLTDLRSYRFGATPTTCNRLSVAAPPTPRRCAGSGSVGASAQSSWSSDGGGEEGDQDLARRSSAWLQEYDGVSDFWVDGSHTEPGLGR